MWCFLLAGLKRAVQVNEEAKGGSDWVLQCTRVVAGDEANEGGGLDGGVDKAASTSMAIASESFLHFKVDAMVEDDSWEARRVTILLLHLPLREPFGGAMVE